MSEVFQTILGGLTKVGSNLNSVLGASKGPLAIADIYAQIQQQQKQKALQDRQIYYAKHPEALANLERSYEQPLSKGLTTGVGNIVQAQMAERGLNQAPGIYGEVLAQALAPYQQQEQQMAINMALQQLGLPGEALATMGKGGQNLPTLLQSLMKSSGGGADLSGVDMSGAPPGTVSGADPFGIIFGANKSPGGGTNIPSEE